MPQRVWRGAGAAMPSTGAGYYLGGIEVDDDGFYDEDRSPIYERLTKYSTGTGIWSSFPGPDEPGLGGRWDSALVSINHVGKEGVLVALGGFRSKFGGSDVDGIKLVSGPDFAIQLAR